MQLGAPKGLDSNCTSVDTSWRGKCGCAHHFIVVGMERARMLECGQNGIEVMPHCDREDSRVVWCEGHHGDVAPR